LSDAPIKTTLLFSVDGFIIGATIPLTAKEQTMWSVRRLTAFLVLVAALCGNGTAIAFD